jgi:hypothetical protein
MEIGQSVKAVKIYTGERMMKYLIALALLATTTAHAQWATYTSESAWRAAIAGAEETVIDFTELQNGQLIGTFYPGLEFGTADRGEWSWLDYPRDGVGVTGGGRFEVLLDKPVSAIAVHHPDQMRLTAAIQDESDPWSDEAQTTLYIGDVCSEAGGPAGRFCGIVAPRGITFDKIIAQDQFDGVAQADDLLLVYAPAEPLLPICGLAAVAVGLIEFVGGVQLPPRDFVVPEPDGCAYFENVATGTVYIGLPVGVMP